MRDFIAVSRVVRAKRWGKDLVRSGGFPVASRLWNRIPDALHHPRPHILGIALTRICNADCTFCAYQFLDKSERFTMPEALFEKICAQVKEMGIKRVQLAPNLGDPLVAPHFLDKVDALRAAGVEWFTLATNGILLDKVGIDAFLARGPDEIGISTTAFDAAMYKRLYRSDQYERMRRNVLGLLRKNRALPPEKRRCIQMRLRIDWPLEEVMKLPDTAEINELADTVEWNTAYADWGGLIKKEHLTGTMAFEPQVPLENRPCKQLYDLAIHPDGEVLACACRNVHHDPDMSLGTLSEMDLQTAWARLERVTENWRNGKVPKTCATCTMYNDPARAWPGFARTAAEELLHKARAR